ncbi:MAG TPA: DUF4147 domain-containing protein, partial [Chloroflexota bacterium]|nr:DUF4147 domain-containing protein [Chloroflexota bacterium]
MPSAGLRTGGQPAAEEVRHPDGPVGLVRPQDVSLTPAPSSQLDVDLDAVLAAALRAVSPSVLLRRASARRLGGVAGRRVTLLAVGKAAAPMASVCLDLLGGHVDAGIVVGPAGGPEPPPPLRWLASAHPVPDERSARAAEAALDLARGVSRDTVLLVLVSGGASSLLALPARGITLEDKRATTARLLAVGADIGALN